MCKFDPIVLNHFYFLEVELFLRFNLTLFYVSIRKNSTIIYNFKFVIFGLKNRDNQLYLFQS